MTRSDGNEAPMTALETLIDRLKRLEMRLDFEGRYVDSDIVWSAREALEKQLNK